MTLIIFVVFFVFYLWSFVGATKMDRTKLPQPMRSNVPGTWAHDTMSRRILEEIFPRVLSDNVGELTQPSHPANAEVLLLLNDLKSSLECGSGGILRGMADKVAPDHQQWDAILKDVAEEERNWLDAPWIVSEYYFYRRIAECFKYFETNYDCFKKQKANGLIEALPSIEEIAERLPLLVSDQANKAESVKVAVLTSLWGNKMDLSLWPASSSGQQISFGAALEASSPYILDDHSEKVVSHLVNAASRRVDIIVDNAGYELVSDFILGHVLLKTGCVDKVVYHTKGHPTFVSDATTLDCTETIGYLLDLAAEKPATGALASELAEHVTHGRFMFIEDNFWCQPTPFWDMPPAVQTKLQGSKMCFVKGDANYRRLLGERQWPLDTPAESILNYWPTLPVCALRTFKAEIGCGISVDAQRRAKAKDEKWMVSGRWGVVQTHIC